MRGNRNPETLKPKEWEERGNRQTWEGDTFGDNAISDVDHVNRVVNYC